MIKNHAELMNPNFTGYCIVSDCHKFILNHFSHKYISLEKFDKQLKEYPWVIEEYIFIDRKLAEEDISWISEYKDDKSFGLPSLQAKQCKMIIEKGLNIFYFNLHMMIEIGTKN